jgi:predicted permease
MDTLMQDLRYAFRTLRRSPAFTIAAVLTLALGIGANTAIFSVVDGVLLRPTPFADVNRVMMVWETDRGSATVREPASVPDYLDFHERSRTFQQLAAFYGTEVSLTPDNAEPTRLAALGTTHEFFDLVGVKPVIGRGFNAEEDLPGGPSTVVISDHLWAQLFSRDPSAIGRTIKIDDSARTVVGIMPPDADFGTLQILRAASYGRGFAERGGRPNVDIWFPPQVDPKTLPRSTHPIFVIGRLANGATRSAAQQEMTSITADLETQYQVNAQRGANVEPLSQVVFGPVRPALLTLLGAVALVLLVACANVANLMLVRGAARFQEVTVRTALGAGSRRLARQFIVEGALLTAVGAGVGMLFAVTGLEFLLRLAPSYIPRVSDVGLDARVLAATLGVSLLVGLVFGFLPTIQARRLDLQGALKDEGGRGASAGREQRRFRSALVVTELALAVMLMISAGLLIKSLWRLQQVDPGFQAAGVIKAEYQLPASRYPKNFANFPRWIETHRFNDELQRRVRALPGVSSVAVASNHPLDAGFTTSLRVIGREPNATNWPEPTVRLASTGYFATLNVPLIEGRRFEESDDVNAPSVAVLNEAAKRMFFDNQSPLGQQVRFWGAVRTVVGVVGNEHFRGLDAPSPPAVYVAAAQVPSVSGSYAVLLRTTNSLESIAPSLRAIARDLDPALPLFGIESLNQTISNSVGQRRFTMLVLGIFAAVALFLAIVGVHGVLSYSVAQRTRELGIRMALGADRSTIRSLVLGQGAALVAGGTLAGLVGGFILTRVLGSLLYGVKPGDPLTFLTVAISLALVGLVATYLPARKAMGVDPAVALRNE